MWLSYGVDTRAGQKVGPADRHCSPFITLRVSSVLLPGNDPKCHYPGVYRVGVFVFVVAQSIQDMPALPITHQAVDIGLPRLR
jgi:hypothetical protein